MKKTILEKQVEQGSLKVEEALRVLFELLHEGPSEAELALESGLLDAHTVFVILMYQARRGRDFPAACLELGFWSEELRQLLEREFTVSLEEVNRRLSGVPEESGSARSMSKARRPRPAVAREPVVSAGAPTEAPSWVTPQGLVWFLELTREVREECDRLIAGLPEVPSRLISRLGFLQGAARLSGSLFGPRMIAALLTRFELAGLEPLEASEIADIKDALALFWEFREGLEKGLSEVTWKEEQRDRCRRAMRTLWLRALRSEATPPLPEAGPARAKAPRAPRLLLVDDSRTVHAFVTELAKARGWELLHASDGSEALELMSKPGFVCDLILLDWEMPKMTGPELLKELKDRDSQLPVVMLTSRNTVSDIESTIALGAREFIMKPFTDDILHEKVARVLGVEGREGVGEWDAAG